jgi:hypothetical protein
LGVPALEGLERDDDEVENEEADRAAAHFRPYRDGAAPPTAASTTTEKKASAVTMASAMFGGGKNISSI